MNFICGACFLVLFWSYPGYLLYLEMRARPRKKPGREARVSAGVSLSVIVPTYNETALIRDKLANLEQSEYSGSVEFFFTDASSDDTPVLIEQGISGWSRPARLVRAEKGRRNQINAALALCSGDAVVVTDVDTILEKTTLEKIGRAFGDPEVAVAGARVEPGTDYGPDRAYWKTHNSVRVLESDLGHCSAVSGGCYAFRRNFFGSIPEGVWSDDIYVPFAAHFAGLRCLYLEDAPARELRAPADARGFLQTKARKAGDYMIELLRFLPRIGEARGDWLVIYCTKLIQVFCAPLAACLMSVCLVLAWVDAGRPLVYLVALMVLGVLGVLLRKKETRISGLNAGEAFKVFILANVSLLTALFLLVRHGGRSWYRKS
jgi:hypothetical protein